MPRKSTTLLLLRDELLGFARSRVMLVLWVILPVLAMGGYFLLDGKTSLRGGMGDGGPRLTATAFMTFLFSSLAGTIAALMVAVDLVNERQRKVYELFIIRPVRREAILWAKFLAVFACVTVACLASIGLGLGVDAVRGDDLDAASTIVRAITSLVGVIGLSAAVGVVCGVMARTVLIAVVLILYVGQNLAIVPMLPVYLGVLPDQFWIFMAITFALIGALVWVGGLLFRREQF